MTFDKRKLKVGDRVFVQAIIKDMDEPDEEFPILIEIDGDTMWTSGDWIVARINPSEETGAANDV